MSVLKLDQTLHNLAEATLESPEPVEASIETPAVDPVIEFQPEEAPVTFEALVAEYNEMSQWTNGFVGLVREYMLKNREGGQMMQELAGLNRDIGRSAFIPNAAELQERRKVLTPQIDAIHLDLIAFRDAIEVAVGLPPRPAPAPAKPASKLIVPQGGLLIPDTGLEN
jgi:hypothetical protein